MTDTSHSRTEPVTSSSYPPSNGADVSGWAGWVVFAGIMMIMLGAFQVIEGLVALFDQGYYLVQTYWESEQAFWDWTNSESFRIAHSNRPPAEMFAGPNVLEIHQVIQSTEPRAFSQASSA